MRFLTLCHISTYDTECYQVTTKKQSKTNCELQFLMWKALLLPDRSSEFFQSWGYRPSATMGRRENYAPYRQTVLHDGRQVVWGIILCISYIKIVCISVYDVVPRDFYVMWPIYSTLLVPTPHSVKHFVDHCVQLQNT